MYICICIYIYIIYVYMYICLYVIYNIYKWIHYIYTYLNKHINNKEYYFLAEDCCTSNMKLSSKKNSTPFVYLSIILTSY